MSDHAGPHGRGKTHFLSLPSPWAELRSGTKPKRGGHQLTCVPVMTVWSCPCVAVYCKEQPEPRQKPRRVLLCTNQDVDRERESRRARARTRNAQHPVCVHALADWFVDRRPPTLGPPRSCLRAGWTGCWAAQAGWSRLGAGRRGIRTEVGTRESRLDRPAARKQRRPTDPSFVPFESTSLASSLL